jgi:hypothetical protein
MKNKPHPMVVILFIPSLFARGFLSEAFPFWLSIIYLLRDLEPASASIAKGSSTGYVLS